ncbi:AraC family transcriptional regulator [Rhodopirellula bahusiensis]|uniref:AraC family transcriptional regulator n=1 Tax=Rhodopirellula bahusiensis TaxID=2014065 RepID=A0A2G1W095_9BACT|nr:AraC family transcriptional regulator [Rhodopirellula bahusiensis]MCR9207286.1 AraC family transcriptional regulator [bacterium]PHQ32466.1 AraC family transcriptional regulator [Rhodopirellula bahusiensis]
MKKTLNRQAFFARLAPGQEILKLFDWMPDVSFFVKDREGRFMALNRRGCEYCGVLSESEAIGKTDHDFFPKTRADEYREDDLQVMESKEAIINRIESAPEEAGSPRLVTTSKIPLKDRRGRVIGVAGFSRQVERMQSGSADSLEKVMQYIHAHYREDIPTGHLAEMAGLSASHFERRFRLAFGASPRQYLIRVRVENAARWLRETDERVTKIAQSCGFYDHAHFSRSFQRIMKMSPTEYRKRKQS